MLLLLLAKVCLSLTVLWSVVFESELDGHIGWSWVSRNFFLSSYSSSEAILWTGVLVAVLCNVVGIGTWSPVRHLLERIGPLSLSETARCTGVLEVSLLGLKKVGLRIADHLSYHFHFLRVILFTIN